MSDSSKTKNQLEKEISSLQIKLAKQKKTVNKLKIDLKNQKLDLERFQKICDAIPNPVIIIQDGQYKFVSSAFCKMFGYSRRDIENGFDYLRLTNPEDKEFIEQRIKDRLAGKELSKTVEIDLVKKNGDIIPCETSTEVIDYEGKQALLIIVRDLSEHRSAADKLTESQTEYSNLFKNILEGVYRTTPDGKIISANPALVKMLGFKSEKELCASANARSLYVNPDDRKILVQKLEEENQLVNVEFDLKRKDGKIITVLENARNIRDENGKIMYYEGLLTDITERKLAEEAYRAAVDNSIQGLLILQNDQVVFANQVFADIIHIEKQKLLEMIPRDLFPSIHPDFRDYLRKRYQSRLKADIGPAQYEFKGFRADGSEFWGEMYVTSIEYRRQPAVQIALIDITDRMQIAEALKESEEQFRHLAEESPNMIFINKAGKVVFVNAKCVEVMGYAVEEFLSDDFNFLDIIHPDHVDNIKKNLAKHLKGLEVPPYEYIIVTKKGKEINAYITTKLIKFEGENAILGIVTDISGLKNVEKELRKTTRELEDERKALEQKNIALKEILSQIEIEKDAIKQQMATNIEKILLPSLQRLKNNSQPTQKKLIEHLEKELESISAPIAKNLKNYAAKLTPRELEICRMIKNGFLSKEISETLNISLLTVHRHRRMIRKKLDISNKDINLSTYLQSL
jgi:PAS domain S-box-containing protein